jgi:translation initiation factor 1
MARDDETRLVYSTGGGASSDTRKGGGKGGFGNRPSPAGGKAKPPGEGKGGIRIRLDRRASDRVVTLVTGLPGSADVVAALCRTLKAACGAGGTVKDGALELQGDHREKVEAVLTAQGLRFKRAGG